MYMYECVWAGDISQPAVAGLLGTGTLPEWIWMYSVVVVCSDMLMKARLCPHT